MFVYGKESRHHVWALRMVGAKVRMPSTGHAMRVKVRVISLPDSSSSPSNLKTATVCSEISSHRYYL